MHSGSISISAGASLTECSFRLPCLFFLLDTSAKFCTVSSFPVMTSSGMSDIVSLVTSDVICGEEALRFSLQGDFTGCGVDSVLWADEVSGLEMALPAVEREVRAVEREEKQLTEEPPVKRDAQLNGRLTWVKNRLSVLGSHFLCASRREIE